MPIKSSAKKALRQNKKRRVLNVARLTQMRKLIKNIKQLSLAGKKNEAAKLLPQAYQAIDKTAKRGIIKKNTAGRKKSQIARLVK